jgi:hypothetical protein
MNHSERCKSYYSRNREKVKAKVREYRAKNIEKVRQKEAERKEKNRPNYYPYFLKYKYGITIDDYNRMLFAQGGVCATNGCMNDGSEDKRRKRLFVDHCHSTGKVRGLLCCTCNRVLGLMKESPDLIRGLASYIEAANAG